VVLLLFLWGRGNFGEDLGGFCIVLFGGNFGRCFFFVGGVFGILRVC